MDDKICCECKFYKAVGENPMDDQCMHSEASYLNVRGGDGIRRVAEAPSQYRCASMLDGVCRDHKLWEAK